jgi:uncharacterized protein (TIGR03086 family)
MTELDTSPITTTAPDPRPVLARVLDQTGDLVLGTDPTDSGRATPCSDYDVATLVEHLLAVVRRVGVVVRGEPFFSVPREWSSTDWAGDWTTGRAETDAALATADLDRPVRVPWGEVPARAALASYVGELATHSWDLAVATGRRQTLDDEIAASALPASMAKLPAEPRGGDVPFGPVVPVADDASATDRLVAWLGRDPGWRP